MAVLNCNQVFSKKHFYKFLKEGVMFSPIIKKGKKALICKQLQSYIELEQSTKIKLENFGKKIESLESGKGVFIRNKNQRFPALIVSSFAGGIRNLFGNNAQSCCTIQIGVVDTLQTNCKNCGYCGKRDEEQLYCDTQDLILSVVQGYFSQICSARAYKIVQGSKVYTNDTYDWVSIPVLDNLISDGTIDGYDKHFVTNKKFKTWLHKTFARVKTERTVLGGTYYGNYIEFTFCENLNCEPFNFEVADYKKHTDTSCC